MRAPSEAADAVDVGWRELHVRGQRVGERPTSRPPMALGWPVIENGPMPGRPMRPVSRWQLMMAFTLSTPALDWLTPCE